MALSLIGVGTTANDGTGDPLRTAFQTVNTAFTSLNSAFAIDSTYLALRLNSTEYARLNSSGLGVGVTPDESRLHVAHLTAPTVKIEGLSSLNTGGGTDVISTISFQGRKSANINVGAKIRARQDGTWSTATAFISPTALEFYTQDNTGVETTTPRMTLKSTGVLNLAATPTSSAGLVSGDVWSNSGVLTIV